MPADSDPPSPLIGIRLPGRGAMVIAGLPSQLPGSSGFTITNRQDAAWQLAPAVAKPHIWLLDDDAGLLNDIEQLHRERYELAMDLQCFRTSVTGDLDFVESLRQSFDDARRQAEGPDLIVLDVNLAFGGYRSDEVAEAIRKWHGGQGVPMIFVTGQPLDVAALDEPEVEDPLRKDHVEEQAQRARRLAHGAETLLHGKAARPEFLFRLVEGLPAWRIQARRRAWGHLLAGLADRLDDSEVQRTAVAAHITDFLHQELNVRSAVLRWRRDASNYDRLAAAGLNTALASLDSLDPDSVPVLRRLLSGSSSGDRDGGNASSRQPLVLNEGLSSEDCGPKGADLVGMRYLGAAAVLHNRCHAFFSLLRHKNEPPFDEADSDGLKAVAALVASALVRAEDLSRMSVRQVRLLEFAQQAALSLSTDDVCSSMVRLLHELVHDFEDSGRVTCRLVNFTSGDLEPAGVRVGYRTKRPPNAIRVDEEGANSSMYARTVYQRTPAKGVELADCHIVEDNVTDRSRTLAFLDTTEGLTRSALCVALVVGKHAIGAVNLEHRSASRYRRADVRFVHAVAAVATQALLNVGMHRFERSMLAFAGGYRSRSRSLVDLEQELDDLLFEFTGYSVLVSIDAADRYDTGLPWQATQVRSRLRGGDENLLRASVNADYQSKWAGSVAASDDGSAKRPWLAKVLGDENWKANWAAYTDIEDDFLPIELSKGLKQTADAILWLRANEQAPPHRALLLLWALPPPMDEQKIELLGQLAQLFSSLQAQAEFIDDQVRARVIGEQQAKIGAVMQHFRHRMKSLTSSLGSDLGDLGRYLQKGEVRRAQDVWLQVSKTSDAIERSFHASRAYVKPVVRVPVRLTAIVQAALHDEAWVARQSRFTVEVDCQIDAELVVKTDPVVASFVVFSLLENAHDALALEHQVWARITLRAHLVLERVVLDVRDNGPGVHSSALPKLFEYGETTKSDGLGSALAFARARLEDAGGQLRFIGNDGPGAHFQCDVPTGQLEERTDVQRADR